MLTFRCAEWLRIIARLLHFLTDNSVADAVSVYSGRHPPGKVFLE